MKQHMTAQQHKKKQKRNDVGTKGGQSNIFDSYINQHVFSITDNTEIFEDGVHSTNEFIWEPVQDNECWMQETFEGREAQNFSLNELFIRLRKES